LNGKNSEVHNSEDVTIQGSVLGPILFAIFVSPLFDITTLTNFADANFEFNPFVNALMIDMQKKLKMATQWQWSQNK
jgi:hypothetical protein